MKIKSDFLAVFIFILFVLINRAPVFAQGISKSNLAISVPFPGVVDLKGDINSGDYVALYSREYNSTEQMITDKLLIETAADTDSELRIHYSIYAEPLAEEQIVPDFDYQGLTIILKALYAVVSDDFSSMRSELVFTDCSIDTGVVNQYWCSLAGSTACGTAAGVIAMNSVYPVYGDDLFTRLNFMRKYSALGDDFSTGPAEYYLAGFHITNAVDKYIVEELSESMVFTDHRTPEKTTEETLIELLTTGRPAVIEVCYLLGAVTRDFQGISHWITINGFTLNEEGYIFRFSDPITVSYRQITSEMLEVSNANVSYGDSGYIPDRYIGAFSEPLFSINNVYTLQ